MSASDAAIASGPLVKPAAPVMGLEDRKELLTPAEDKNESNEPLCESIIKSEWNRHSPTEGIVYPRCVPELVRRIRAETGSGSDAAVKRYIKVMCSDGADWRIDRRTRRVLPSNFELYNNASSTTQLPELQPTKRMDNCVLCSKEYERPGEWQHRTCPACMNEIALETSTAAQSTANGAT